MSLISQTIYIDGQEISPKKITQNKNISTLLDKTKRYISELAESTSHPDLAFVRALLNKSEINSLKKLISNWAKEFENLVVLGTGGSSIGGQALCSILKYKKFSDPQLNVNFLDNLGHHQMAHMFDGFDLGKTKFLVISKSGGTAETIAQCLISMEAIRSATNQTNIKNHFTVIVQPGESPLRNLAQEEGFHIIDHDEDLGGRFSALSMVGLTPAAAMGFDANIAIKAAQEVYQTVINPNTPIIDNSPLISAALQAHLVNEGVSQSLFIPYESRLIDFSRWYQQLWAESLGKDGKGTSPVRALGPLDQHSQLQLYLDGPRDKFFTFLLGNAKNIGFRINKSECDKYGVNYLADHTIGDLVHAEAEASINALVERGIPVRVLRYETLDEDFMGELMALFFMETLFMAKMIGVHPFGQPAVERSKTLTKEYLAASKNKKN